MKYLILVTFLILSGCGGDKPAGDVMKETVEPVKDAVESAVEPVKEAVEAAIEPAVECEGITDQTERDANDCPESDDNQ